MAGQAMNVIPHAPDDPLCQTRDEYGECHCATRLNGWTQVLLSTTWEGGGVIDTWAMIANGISGEGWPHDHDEADAREALDTRGWYEGHGDNGRFLILNLDKFDLRPKTLAVWPAVLLVPGKPMV